MTSARALSPANLTPGIRPYAQIGFNETGKPTKEDGTVPMVGVTSDVLNKLKGKEMPGYAYIIINPKDNPKDRLKQTKEIIHVDIRIRR